MDVTAGETAPVPKIEDPDEDSTQEFVDRVLARRDRAARLLAKPAPIDWNRVADTHQRKAKERIHGAPKASRVLYPADSPEECRRCGIPGRKGCEHQLPYEAPAPLPEIGAARPSHGGVMPSAFSPRWLG